MVSVSGVRGIYGDTLTPMIAMDYAAHFGMFCGKGKIIIGRDSRTTGIAMFQALAAGLTSVGCDVIDLGIVATPTVLLAVEESEAVGGICITASHNPPEWNAMKFVGKNGMFLFPEQAAEFIASLGKPVIWADWSSIGNISLDPTATQRHINKILAIPYLNVEAIRACRFRVVLDSVNGAGSQISPLLLKALGCEVIEINSEPTGIFAHPAEPLNQNLTQLEAAVALHKADIGFATDPDVDRLSIVSDLGKCIGEELSIALAELFVLPKRTGDIVVNLSSSMLTDAIAGKFGSHVWRTKVGEINVGKKMQEISAPIGGEGNGGIICPEVHYTRDAPVGMALILGYLAEQQNSADGRKVTLSEVVEKLPKFYFAKGKIETTPDLLDQIMANTLTAFAGLDIDTQDGIKATAPEYWIHVRKSGTEPIIRVYVESPDLARSNQICQETITKITQ